jgi:hypothetical protein
VRERGNPVQGLWVLSVSTMNPKFCALVHLVRAKMEKPLCLVKLGSFF